MTLEDLDPNGLYHLATADEWAGYQRDGVIDPRSLADEGFVHCSWGAQVPGTVTKHFAGVSGLLALRLDVNRLGDLVVVEEDTYASGAVFPHIYGSIPADAVLETISVS